MKSNLRILFLVILLTGIFLRLYAIENENIWTDEAVTLMEIDRPINEIYDQVKQTEVMPYGYHFLMHYWIKYFGTSELSLRLPSVIFGILSIIVMFLLGNTFFNKKVALLSSLLMSTSMLQVVYSQEARPYAMFGFLALLSTYFLVKYVKEKKYFNLYILSLVLCFYTNYFASFLLLFQGIGLYYYYEKKYIKEWITVVISCIIAFIPLIPLVFFQVSNKYFSWVEVLPKFGVPIYIAKLGILFFLIPLGLCVLGLLLLIKYKNQIKFNLKYFMIFLILSGLGYLFLLDTLSRSFTLVRHSYFMVPILYLFIAVNLLKLKHKSMFILLFLLLNSFALWQYYEEPNKPQWGNAVDYLDKNTFTKNIVFDRQGSNVFIFKYYSKGYTILEDPTESFWLISSRNIKNKDEVFSKYNDQFTLQSTKSFKDIELSLFMR